MHRQIATRPAQLLFGWCGIPCTGFQLASHSTLANGCLVATINTVFAGDNATTGSAIARQAGILPSGCRVFRPADQDDLLANLQQLGAPPAAFQRYRVCGR